MIDEPTGRSNKAPQRKSYRAVIYISGAQTECAYASNMNALARKAVKSLTLFEPGFGNLWPDRIELQEQVRKLSGNAVTWKTVGIVRYTEVLESQHEWRRRKTARQVKNVACSVPDCGCESSTHALISINSAPKRDLPVCAMHAEAAAEDVEEITIAPSTAITVEDRIVNAMAHIDTALGHMTTSRVSHAPISSEMEAARRDLATALAKLKP